MQVIRDPYIRKDSRADKDFLNRASFNVKRILEFGYAS
jgi:hypothetical protein